MKCRRRYLAFLGVLLLFLFSCKKSTKPVIPGWEVLYVWSNVILFKVDFVDSDYGWVIGSDYQINQYIFHTTDGGKTWVQQSAPPPPGNFPLPFNDIYFIDRQNGWGVGSFGDIYKTTDGGDNWTLAETLGFGSFHTIFFTDLRHGWADGGAGLGDWRTTDGGETWEKIPFWDSFIDSLDGWAGGGSGAIYRTYDGGVNWTKVYTEDGSGGTSLDFVDLYNGWGLKGGRISEYDFWYWIIHTVDGGYTWELQLDTFKYRLFGVFGSIGPMEMLNSRTGWIAKHEELKGTVLHTINGGITWREQPLPDIGDRGIIDMDFINENEGWAITSSPSNLPSLILRTKNGGNPIR